MNRPKWLSVPRSWFLRLAPRYGPHYGVASQTILRGLGILYVISFWSAASQILGLSGSGGLHPAPAFYEFLRQNVGDLAPLFYPGLGWISQSPLWMYTLCGIGALGGLGLLYGFLPWISGVVAWTCWVSLIQLTQPWLTMSGDLLLAEMGLYALFLVPVFSLFYPKVEHMASRLVGIILLNALTLRMLFSSGLGKLVSPSGVWQEGTALYHFFETQTLPTLPAWFFHQLPGGMLTYLLWGWMFIELMLPWYIFLPRVFRNICAGGLLLRSLFFLTVGHYGVTPLLGILLAASLVDDVSWRRCLPLSWGPPASIQLFRPGVFGKICLLALLPLLLFQTFSEAGVETPRPWKWVQQTLGRVYVGVTPPSEFSVPTERVTLSLQGSADGRNWIEYPFWLKPSYPNALPAPGFVHTPRLDVALERVARSATRDENESQLPIWMFHLIQGLLEGDPRINSLFPINPFPDNPPRHLRLVLYELEFSDPATRREENVWWERTPLRLVGPVFSLKDTP